MRNKHGEGEAPYSWVRYFEWGEVIEFLFRYESYVLEIQLMAEIVYFLGAGFSAPAGVPVISNFLFKAKDQYFQRPEEFANFKQVFEYIDKLAVAKNFTNINLHNVEEVFSIADTHELLHEGQKRDLQNFIVDVVKYHTPKFEKHMGSVDVKRRSFEELLSNDNLTRKYVSFMAMLLGLEFESSGMAKVEFLEYNDLIAVQHNTQNNYKFVSLNYDNIIENSVHFISANFRGSFSIDIAKLHGSVDGEIVPPTWNKKLNPQIGAAWRKAARWLSDASEIRILGYSLPETDIYIKHLFSVALMVSKNLQRIDVICLDPDGSVRDRFDKMFTYPRYNFHVRDLSLYIESFSGRGCQHSPFATRSKATEETHRIALEIA